MIKTYEEFQKLKPYITELVTEISSTNNSSPSSVSDVDIYAAIAEHESEIDPHPQYMTEAESDARYYTESESDSRFVSTSTTVTGTGALTGGGSLNVNRTITMKTPATLSDTTTNSNASNHTHEITAYSDVSSGITGLLKSLGGGLALTTLTTSAEISGAYNTNSLHSLGYAGIGYMGYAGFAGFAANNFATTTGYAILQSNTNGDLLLNAPTGRNAYFKIANATVAYWGSTGFFFPSSKHVKSEGYVSGFAGSGWNIDQNISVINQSFAEFDNLSIRGTMSVYELLINQIRATNGTLFVTAAGTIESISGSNWTFKDPTSHNLCPFAVNDLVIIQRVDTDSTSIIQRIVRRVTAVSGSTITVTTVAGFTDTGSASIGDTVVRFGNSTNTARQGSIMLTADMANAPYIDIINGVTSWADWTGGTKTKMRIGLLSGITGTANEYGFIAGNGFTISDSYIKASSVEVTQNNVVSKFYASGVEQIRISATTGIDLNIGTNAYNDITWYNGMGGALRTKIGAYTDGSYGALDLITYSPSSTSYFSQLFLRATNADSYIQMRIVDTTNGTVNNYFSASAVDFNSDELILTGLGASERLSINNGFKNRTFTDASYNTSEISNDDGTYKALMLLGNTSYDAVTRRVNLYDTVFIGTRLEVGQGRSSQNVSQFTGRQGTSGSVSLAATEWGKASHIGFNAYLALNSGSYSASGAWKYLGSQYTGNVTRAGLLTMDGNAGSFSFRISEAGLANEANITSWSEIFRIDTSGNVTSFGSVTAGSDTDIISTFGRTKLGHASYSDWAAFSHFDMTAAGNYGIIHSNVGRLLLNAATGQNIGFRINNTDVMYMNATGLHVGAGTAPTYTLQVTGKAYVNQSNLSLADAALTINQADLSEEFINFTTTVGTGNAVDTAAVGTAYAKLRVAVNGTFKYIQLYNT